MSSPVSPGTAVPPSYAYPMPLGAAEGRVTLVKFGLALSLVEC
jgi:hypothetical protein